MDDSGYTKIKNSFITKLMTSSLTASEFKVLLFVLRQSECFHRKETNSCSYAFIANGCHITKRMAIISVNSLIKKKYLEVGSQGKGRAANTYKIRDEILHTSSETDFTTKTTPEVKFYVRGSETHFTSEVKQISPLEVKQISPKETKGKVKDINKRKKKENHFSFSKNSAPACERNLPRPADAEDDDWEV